MTEREVIQKALRRINERTPSWCNAEEGWSVKLTVQCVTEYRRGVQFNFTPEGELYGVVIL
jgi:hypothetical protein